MKELIIISQVVVYLAKAMDFIYLFQIKEYRLDRVYSYLKEKGLLKALYNGDLRMPGKKIRNYLILFGLLGLLPIFYIGLEPVDIPSIIIISAIIPFVSFFSTMFFCITDRDTSSTKTP